MHSVAPSARLEEQIAELLSEDGEHLAELGRLRLGARLVPQRAIEEDEEEEEVAAFLQRGQFRPWSRKEGKQERIPWASRGRRHQTNCNEEGLIPCWAS